MTENKDRKHNFFSKHKGRKHNFFHRKILLLFLIAILSVFLFGHSRWGGWGHHKDLFSGDTTRVEEALTEIEEKLADKLDIRPEQEAGFKAYAEKMKTYARKRLAAMGEIRRSAHDEIDKENPDVDRLAELAKEMIRQRGNTSDLDAVVDETVAFYKTLDAEQQEEIQSHMKRHRRWHK